MVQDGLRQTQVAIPDERAGAVVTVEGAVIGGGDLQGVFRQYVEEDVEAFVDGGVEDGSAKTLVVGGEVGAAAGEGDADGCAGYEHN